MVDIKFCRKSGCDYYFNKLDDCMYGDKNLPKDYLRICKTSRYQVYLIGKRKNGEGESNKNMTVRELIEKLQELDQDKRYFNVEILKMQWTYVVKIIIILKIIY